MRALLPLLLLSACRPSAAPPKPRLPPLVVTAVVTREDVPLVVRAPIDLKPVAQADIGSKTVGLLDAVLVDRGDVVRRGQLLALVRPSDLPDQLAVAKNAIAQATAARGLAKANLERAQALAPKGLVSQQELQSATNAAAVTEAQLGAAEAQLSALAVRLGETRLEAPYDGVVLSRRLDPGALVGPTAGAVVTVAKVDHVRAFVAVTERDAHRVQQGQPARVRVDALAGQVFAGKVERLAPAFDPLTRTLDAEVHLPNEARLLRPGMYGRGEIEVGLHRQVPVVPAEAVQLADGKAYVFVVAADAAHRRRVELGEDLGANLEIAAGLEGGEELVVHGIDGLADGAAVRRAPGRAQDAGVPAPAKG